MNFLSKFRTDEYLKRYAIYFFGSMAVAFFNYLFHPILAHFISPEKFGEVQAFLSLIAQFGIVFGAFFIVSVHITTNIDDEVERNQLLSELQRICFYLAAIMVLVMFFLSSQIKLFLNLQSYAPIFGACVMVLLGTSTTIRGAFLQGRGMFKEFSIQSGISAIGRLFIVLPLLFLESGIYGVIFAVILSQILSIFYSYWCTRKSLSVHAKTDIQVLERKSIRSELQYGLLVLFGSGFTTFFYSADVLIVKHFFNAYDAGLYTGISSIAKIVFIILTSVCAVLLSMVRMKNSRRENSVILMKSLAIAVGMAAVIFPFFFWQYRLLASVIVGAKYLGFSYLLPNIGFTMFLLSIVSIFVFYFLALRRYVLIGISLISFCILMLLLKLNHPDIGAIVTDLQITLGITIAMFIVYYGKSYVLRDNN